LKRIADRKPLLFFVMLALLAFLLWLAVLTMFWGGLQLVGVRSSLWALIEALSTAAAMAFVIGAGYLAYQELNEAQATRHMDVADRLFAELNARDSIADRRWVYQNMTGDPETDLKQLDDTGRDRVKHVLNSLDRVAFLTQPGWVPEEMVMPWMSLMVVKAWEKLEPYVMYERDRRVEPDYYASAEDVAQRCQRWRMKKKLANQATWVDGAL
jgi:hypothetical protein